MTILRAVLVAAALASAPAALPTQEGGAGATRPVTCTLSNPAYSGYCKVTTPAAKDQAAADACQEVLSCLNNVQCSKTYCNATQVRGGWKLVSSEEGSGK